MTKINLEIDWKYQEHLDLVKELILNEEWNEITNDSEAVEILLESFVGFLQEQAQHAHEHNHEHGDDCCGHDHK